MRVLWPHNFDPAKRSAGVFMFTAAEGLRSLGVDVQLQYLGNLRSPLNIFRGQMLLREKAKDFDLVHAQFGSACSLAASAVDACPRVVSIRGNDWNLHRETVGFLALHTYLARFMTRHSLPKYDLAIAVSRRMERDLKQAFPRVAFAALPAPVDLDTFKPLEKVFAREMLGFRDNGEYWVLYNSLRLNDPVKRFSLAARAVELANKKMGNIRLRIASDIPHKEMPLFVAACDLILCTSETEGWPNSIKEALACNVPFVSTDVSDLMEIADREPSCRVAAADPVALANGICEVLAFAPRADLRKYVLPMGIRQTSEAMLKLYCGLLQGRKA